MSQNLSEAVEFIANELEKEFEEWDKDVCNWEDVSSWIKPYVQMLRLAVIMAKPTPVASPVTKEYTVDEFLYDPVKKCYTPKNTKEFSDAVS